MKYLLHYLTKYGSNHTLQYNFQHIMILNIIHVKEMRE